MKIYVCPLNVSIYKKNHQNLFDFVKNALKEISWNPAIFLWDVKDLTFINLWDIFSFMHLYEFARILRNMILEY